VVTSADARMKAEKDPWPSVTQTTAHTREG
jgi:hypothetical protein